MSQLDQNLIKMFLREIDARLTSGLLPVHDGHLRHVSDSEPVLNCLLLLKKQGLISGDVVTKGAAAAPCRMTNIRLTYLGIKTIRS